MQERFGTCHHVRGFPLLYPAPGIPYTGAPTPHLHAGGGTLAEAGLEEENEREGLQDPQTPLQIQGEPLSLTGHSDHHDSGKSTPNN